MTSQRWIKYPRTMHHPSSPGVQSDDKVARDLSAFEDAEVVITEKMDGENTTLYADGYHARSIDSGYHPSRSWLAGFHGAIAHLIPSGWRICGENLYAQHSVKYTSLQSFFLAYSAWNSDNACPSFDETCQFLSERDIETVPLLARGPYSEGMISDVVGRIDTNGQEGFVIRLAQSFVYGAFPLSVMKWVRAGHVQSHEHWRHGPLIANQLLSGEGK